MAETKPLENDGDPGVSSNGGNTDWKAKYEAEVQAHNVTTQQRNMYKNQAEELTTKVETLGNEKDSVSAELDRVKSEAEKTAKQSAAQAKQSEILSKFDPETVKKAKELELELSDAEDADAVAKFEAKLQTLQGDKPAEGKAPEGEPKPKAPPVNSDNRRLDDQLPPKPKSEEDQIKDMEARIAAGEFDDVKL